MSNWQPIETVPKDGTWFLVYLEHMPWEYEKGPYAPWKCKTVRWVGLYEGGGNPPTDAFREFGPGQYTLADMTHWMPLPAPPEDK